MKTVLVSDDVYGLNPNAGGIATWTKNFCQLLSEAGHQVSILGAHGKPYTLDPTAKAFYDNLGVSVEQIPAPDLTRYEHVGFVYRMRAELVAEQVQSADIVYFHDYHANGYHLVKQKRFSYEHFPICITNVICSTEWINHYLQRHPTIPNDLHLGFMERYCVEHSDYVIIPSNFMHAWMKSTEWVLPDKNRVHRLGYPYFEPYPATQHVTGNHADQFQRIIFFGRLDRGKGFDLFVEVLLGLQLSQEVVFLGMLPSANRDRVEATLATLRNAGYTVISITDKNTLEAQAYLRDHVSDSLVVMPSLLDNFPNAVLEASLIEGLNFICSNQGGQPDIIGTDNDQLFYPDVRNLRQKLLQWLERGPRPADELGRYDAEGANQQLLDFHEQMIDEAKVAKQSSHVIVKPQPQEPVIDVCIAYYNHADYLPYTLLSLAQQTVSYFNVIVIDDGSTDPRAIEVFEQMKAKYPQWTFVQQENQGVVFARNYAVSLTTCEYIIIVDSDDIVSRYFVERYYEAIVKSECDSLFCYSDIFTSGVAHVDGKHYISIFNSIYRPLGSHLTEGILENVFGGAQIIIQRRVFEELGGYQPPSETAWEDFGLLTRLILAGYTHDVVPEVLYYYRELPNSRERSRNVYLAEMRILQHYDAKLRAIGMRGLAQSFLAIYQHHKQHMVLLDDLDQGNQQGQAYIQQLEAQVEQFQQQIDEQTQQLHEPSLRNTLRLLYRAIIPLTLRVQLKNIVTGNTADKS